jgi:hypothetical protein
MYTHTQSYPNPTPEKHKINDLNTTGEKKNFLKKKKCITNNIFDIYLFA